tara:strand:+ start:85 stop:354 length:270 start_codon:yes stop_codon:yes gene_type:complete
MEDKRIRSLEELKEYCKQDDNKCISESEVYILLNGMLRSSKYIQYYEDNSWWIEHQISDTEIEYKNDKEFKENEPMIFEAMEKGCLIKY